MSAAGFTLGSTPAQILAAVGILSARNAAVMKAGIELQGVWKEQLNQPGSGETYEVEFRTIDGRVVPVGKRSSPHTASAPGDSPAPDTGQLKQSIAVADVGVRGGQIGGVRVGTGLRYGLALEYGVNVSGSKTGPHPDKNFVLQARPHARPALVRAMSKMTKGLRTRLQHMRLPSVTPREL